MASTINFYLDTPFGKLQVYADPKKLAKAEKLLKDMPYLLFNSYKKTAEKLGKKVVEHAKYCVERSIPPTGVSWPPLSKDYARKRSADPIGEWYYDGACFFENIGIQYDKMEYLKGYTGIKTGARVYIGLPQQKYHNKMGIGSRSNKKPPLTLQKIGKILENGTRDGKVKPRPLWAPLYKIYFADKNKVRKSIETNLRNQLRPYM